MVTRARKNVRALRVSLTHRQSHLTFIRIWLQIVDRYLVHSAANSEATELHGYVLASHGHWRVCGISNFRRLSL